MKKTTSLHAKALLFAIALCLITALGVGAIGFETMWQSAEAAQAESRARRDMPTPSSRPSASVWTPMRRCWRRTRASWRPSPRATARRWKDFPRRFRQPDRE